MFGAFDQNYFYKVINLISHKIYFEMKFKSLCPVIEGQPRPLSFKYCSFMKLQNKKLLIILNFNKKNLTKKYSDVRNHFIHYYVNSPLYLFNAGIIFFKTRYHMENLIRINK